MKAIDSVLDRVETFLCVILFAAMIVITCLQIIFRHVGLGVAWTDESARYLFVWLIYIGSIKAVRGRKHLKVDILNLVVKDFGHYVFELIGHISTIVFWVIMSYFMWNVVYRYIGRPQYSAALKINMAFMYAAPLVCGVLSLVRSLQNIARCTSEYHALKNEKKEDA